MIIIYFYRVPIANWFKIKNVYTLIFILLGIPFILKAQDYCEPIVSPVGSNAPTEPISLVQFGEGANAINNASSSELSVAIPKYEDFSFITMDVEKGSTYTLIVEGNTDGNNTNYITVYIDWNQNGVFSNSLSQNEKYQYTPALINSNGQDNVQMVYDITIPEDAVLGTTRMRIVKNYQAPSPDPCYPVATFGQTEDYTLNVIAANECGSVTSLYENFDDLSCCEMGVVPNCWNSIRLEGASQIISSTNPASGTSQIYQTGYGNGKISVVILPHFSNLTEGTHQFRFKVKANSGPGILEFGYVTDQNDAETFIMLESLTISNTSYDSSDSERVLLVPDTVPQEARLAIRNPGTTWAGMYWDDVYWEPISITAIEVATVNNVPAEITGQNNTLQLLANITPSTASQQVVWSIISGEELASVDSNGVVTAISNGTITVRATSIVDATKYDDINITISMVLSNIGFEKEELSLYPNPTKSLVYIQTASKVKLVELYNLSGQKMLQQTLDVINLTMLKSGIYMVKIYMEDEKTVFKKIVKD